MMKKIFIAFLMVFVFVYGAEAAYIPSSGKGLITGSSSINKNPNYMRNNFGKKPVKCAKHGFYDCTFCTGK